MSTSIVLPLSRSSFFSPIAKTHLRPCIRGANTGEGIHMMRREGGPRGCADAFKGQKEGVGRDTAQSEEA
eukprot:6075627-Pleurochrysis_carterae.AAC.1